MSQNTYRKNIPKISIKKDESSNYLKLGGSMILGPKFDIKKFLNSINIKQNSAKKEKDNLPPLFDNLYMRIKNDNRKYELSTIVNNHIQNHRKNQNRIKSPSIVSTSISNNNNSITNINNRNSNNNTLNASLDDNFKFKLNKNSSRKTYATETNLGSFYLYKKNKVRNNDEENFNFAREIKEIKKYAELSSKNKSIKNIMSNKIAFDPKNLDVVYKPINIINSYNKYKQSELSQNKDEISTFLSDSKDNSKNNVIIKLLNNQKMNYQNDINERQKTIDNNRRTLEMYQNNFSIFTTSQKMVCRKMDDLVAQLVTKSRNLLKEMYKLRSEVRIKEDEKQKYLERIDELRVIAKFVTKVLGINYDIFKFKIIPEYSSERLPDYEHIAKEVFERYIIFLNEEEETKKENINKEDTNIIKQMNNLNDPELLYDQFYQIEEDIINTLKNKEVIEKEIVEIKKEGKKQIEDIQKRIEVLKNELNLYKSIYEREQNEYEEIYKRNYTGEGEFDDFIKELYSDVFGVEKINKKSKKNYFNVNRAANDILKTIVDKEIKINKLIIGLEQYEKEDNYLFVRLAHHRKNENKEMKINIMKKIIEAGEKEKINQLIIPEEKIIFIQRKCEPPFHVSKKKKKVVIDPELIRQIENEELITYK